MDRELLDRKGIHEGDDVFKPQDDQGLLSQQGQAQGTAAEKKVKELNNLAEVLAVTVDHFFPYFNEWLGQIRDSRDQDRVVYSRQTIIWAAINLMLTRRGSRKKISDELRADNVFKNLAQLGGQADLEGVPHGDTVEYFFIRAQEEDFQKFQTKLIRSVIRSRVLESHRLFNTYYTIAIDGVYTHSYDYPHCPECLVRESKDGSTGKKRWYHGKLQASLVTTDGLCLPLMSEWIRNEGFYDKQDCELKAFYRLAKKIRAAYSRLPICLLLDGLYAVEPVFETLKRNQLEGIVVFKEGRSPEVYRWVMNRKANCGKDNVLIKKREIVIPVRTRRTHQEKFLRSAPQHETRTVTKELTYSWKQGIEHWEEPRTFNVMTCKEVNDGRTYCDYVWLVTDGLRLDSDTVVELSERGRCRWKIENEGINIEKNGGYGLEHQYSRDPVSMRIWCRIIDIAHLISQLIERGFLHAKKMCGSLRNIANRLYEHLRYFVFEKPQTRPRIQIRLRPNTS